MPPLLLPSPPFFRFTSCQPRRDPAQGINLGACTKKNKKGSSRAGSQEATMIQHPPLNVSKEGRRGSGITGGKAGYNIGRE